ncbi:MAG: VWA domain-containing protein [Candidatus Aenigmatarchaeota archaeon]
MVGADRCGKKGIFFSLDAILAIVILISVVGGLGLYYTVTPQLKYSSLHSSSEDAMTVLSTARVGDTGLRNKSYVQEEDYNKTVLQLIGTLWVSGETERAKNVTSQFMENTTDSCWKLTFSNTTIEKSEGDCSQEEVVSAARVVSGYNESKRDEGYITRGFLSEADSKLEKSYIFFGGYVGDGNITKNITLRDLDEIYNMTMELDAGSDFDLVVNDEYSGSYQVSEGNMSADRWNVDRSYWDNFQEDENKIQFVFTGNKSSISGGFFRVTYNTTGFQYRGENKNYTQVDFPGIDGVINLYSSFYSPTEIRNITARLHYRSNHTVFLSIGNVTVYNGSSPLGEDTTVSLTDSQIRSELSDGGLPYSYLSKKTVPFRLGIMNVSYIENQRKADVFSVTDISGSMDECNVPANSSDYDCYYSSGECSGADGACCWFYDCGSESGCEYCGGSWLDPGYYKEKITVAKESNKDFVDIVLNSTGNRAGLVSYNDDVDDVDTHDLSTDQSSLEGKVDEWGAGGGTCICCGVNDATDRIETQSNQSRFRSVVVMSDGQANYECGEQGTGNPDDDAIQAACDAYEDHGAKVYTIGFGANVDEATLQNMADCGHGEYYYSNVSELRDVYKTIAQEILNASYEAQRVVVHGGSAENITLYQDSYLGINHSNDNSTLDYGEIPLSFESESFGTEVSSPQKGWFWAANRTRPLEARITSYSGKYWTSIVNISNENGEDNIYRLSDYGTEYTDLGDPYTVNIPTDKMTTGNNTVLVDTSINPANYTGASPDDRVIYQLAVGASVDYGDSFSKYQGGNVTVQLETGETYELSVGNASDAWDPEEDALDDMVERLLDKLDADGDGKIGIKLEEDNLEIKEIKVDKVPYLWGPSIFRLRMW